MFVNNFKISKIVQSKTSPIKKEKSLILTCQLKCHNLYLALIIQKFHHIILIYSYLQTGTKIYDSKTVDL